MNPYQSKGQWPCSSKHTRVLSPSNTHILASTHGYYPPQTHTGIIPHPLKRHCYLHKPPKKHAERRGNKPDNLARKTAIAVRELVIAKVIRADRVSVRGRIDAVAPSRRTDMRAVDRRTQRNHILMHHATEQRVLACYPY